MSSGFLRWLGLGTHTGFLGGALGGSERIPSLTGAGLGTGASLGTGGAVEEEGALTLGSSISPILP